MQVLVLDREGRFQLCFVGVGEGVVYFFGLLELEKQLCLVFWVQRIFYLICYQMINFLVVLCFECQILLDEQMWVLVFCVVVIFQKFFFRLLLVFLMVQMFFFQEIVLQGFVLQLSGYLMVIFILGKLYEMLELGSINCFLMMGMNVMCWVKIFCYVILFCWILK